jgi:subtilisin family serine protease
MNDRGYFSAAFTCHGPEIDVCAPGVAVVSSVPPDGFAVWDGTSMAAPHVAGLAALVLAHNPDFSAGQGRGTAARVDRLFSVTKASATPLNLGDLGRTGVDVPDAVAAVTGSRPGGMQQPSDPVTVAIDPQVISAALDRLRDRFKSVGLL